MSSARVREETIERVTGRLMCSPPSPRYKLCKENAADFVCHECGAPLCVVCSKSIKDPGLFKFVSIGKKLLIGILALIIIPVISSLLSGLGFGLVAGVFSGIIIFIGVIAPFELLSRKDVDESGRARTISRLVIRKYDKVVHCRKCAALHSTESQMNLIITSLAILLMLVGLAGIIMSISDKQGAGGFLIFLSFGVAILSSRTLLVDIITKYLKQLKL